MEFTFKEDNSIGVYELQGNLIGEKDGITITESFTEQLDNGLKNFVIDLQNLQHINSSGLGVLVSI